MRVLLFFLFFLRTHTRAVVFFIFPQNTYAFYVVLVTEHIRVLIIRGYRTQKHTKAHI